MGRAIRKDWFIAASSSNSSGRGLRFRLMPTITRPDAGWHGRTGWVQQHIEEALEGCLDADVYICGLRAMVDDVRENLKRKGLARQQIIYKKYD